MVDKSKISGTRMMFTIAFFLQSSALLTSFVSGITLQDSWISIIFASVLFIPIMFLFKAIMTRFPEYDLIEILRMVFGRVIGNIICLLYLFFFIILTALNLNDLGEFAKLTVMFQTPKIVLLLMCIAVASFAVRHGLGVVTRYSALFTILEFIIVGTSILLVLNQFEFSAFQPMFNLEIGKYIQSTHIILTIPTGETVIFLMLSPNIKMEKKKMTKYWLGGLIMGLVTLFFVMVRDIGVLGNSLHLFKLPGLITLRLINLGVTLSRVEILFAAGLMFLLFFKVSLLLYVSIRSISSFFKLKSFKNITLIVGLFDVFLALTLYSDPILHSHSAENYTVFVWTLMEIIFPLLLMIVALIRKMPKQVKQQNENFEDTPDNEIDTQKAEVKPIKKKRKKQEVT